MSDLIRREDALNATKMVYIECLIIDEKDYEEGMADDLAVVFASDIKKIPAVDAVPVVHGRWIPKGYTTFKNKFEEVQIPTFFKCSECGTVRTDKYNYCPNCGAKMDGERREHETD